MRTIVESGSSVAQARMEAKVARLVEAASASLQSGRVQPLTLSGRRLWLKRAETQMPWRLRLQKGNPQRALRADIAGLRFMARHGLAAPELLSAQPGALVTADVGVPLSTLLADDTVCEAEKARALASAMAGLAALHRAGGRHGRPKLRDICWDGQTARLIDFERFRASASVGDRALDWLIALHSLLEVEKAATPLFIGAVKAYMAEAPAATSRAALRRMRLVRLVQPLLRALLRAKPRNKEMLALRALPGAFDAAINETATMGEAASEKA